MHGLLDNEDFGYTYSQLLPFIREWEVFDNITWDQRHEGFPKLEYFLSKDTATISTIFCAMGADKDNSGVFSPDQVIQMMGRIKADNQLSCPPPAPPNSECDDSEMDSEVRDPHVNQRGRFWKLTVGTTVIPNHPLWSMRPMLN